MFRLSIDTDNDAFAEGCEATETARILRTIARQLDLGQVSGKAVDGNGNVVGKFTLFSEGMR